MYLEVLPAKLFRKSPIFSDGILTYSYHKDLKPGTIVSIPLGKREVVGIVYRKTKKPDFQTKDILKVLYEKPIPEYLLKSIIWLSSYYLSPLPQVVSLFLPNTLEKRHKLPAISTQNELLCQDDAEVPLNPAQKRALEGLKASGTNTKLLHGVTGSGKTNIYLTLAKEAFSRGESTILLVPEIALTSQLVQIFEKTFKDDVVLIHSKQTEKTRRETWEKILLSDRPKIVVGPRSALFAPLHNLGLIIIDEAHENAYFQEQTPKYSALRLASFIASFKKISCIFGTATPLVSDYYLAKSRGSLVTLKEKAKKTAILPNTTIIDFRDRKNFSKNRFFSNQLLEQIKQNLKNGHQTLIYHNRRGSAPITICENCGWQALCPNCFLPLTLHSDSFTLTCHTCGYQDKIPTSCPECSHTDIIHKGFGTKLLENELKKLFKTARIARFDADNEKDKTLDNLYDEVKNGEIDIIIGTQTIARGLDLPHLATVGIVQADSGLSLPDYSSEERTFHLLTQVLGRVGRGHLTEANAFIQTYHPENPIITCAINSDYDKFYSYLIKTRQKSHFPPFFFIAKISVVFKTEKIALREIKKVYDELQTKDKIYFSAPTPAFHEYTNSGYVWQLVLKSSNRKNLVDAIQNLQNFSELRISLDPPSLL